MNGFFLCVWLLWTINIYLWKNLTNFTFILLENNGIGEDGASKLADGLKSLQNISHLDLSLYYNIIGDNIKNELKIKLKKFNLNIYIDQIY